MKTSGASRFDCLTVTLNPAIDRTLTIPSFRAGVVNRVEGESLAAGGKGVNVASALAAAGHKVAATGFLGRDNPGMFEELFVRRGITDYFIRIGGGTRTGLKITDPVLNHTTDINFPGIGPKRADLEQLQKTMGGLDADWIVLGGSLPPRVDPSFYRETVTQFKSRGCKVAVDASGVPLSLAVDALPDLIKPNIQELETLLDCQLTTRAKVLRAARELVVRGVGLVAVSMGKEGALFATERETIWAIPPPTLVRSTVGAGDAMVAGVVSGISRNLPIEAIARLATAFSVNAISTGNDSIESISKAVTIE